MPPALSAITHHVSPRLNECELSFRQREAIAYPRAVQQHRAYCDLLRRQGISVIELSANRDFPDSVFVEDTAVVVDEVAVICRMGAPSRRGEELAVAAVLAEHRPLAKIAAPAALEGGDVLQIGKNIFVGQGSRSNPAGARALADALKPFGYRVIPVELHGCLHLKSACTALDEFTVIMNPDWVSRDIFREYRVVTVPPQEPEAANVLRLNETVCLISAFPRTVELVHSLGYRLETLDISELLKAEAALTCSSIIFKTSAS